MTRRQTLAACLFPVMVLKSDRLFFETHMIFLTYIASLCYICIVMNKFQSAVTLTKKK